MKRLWVLRHAKSAWGQGLADHDRPLSGRGERAAVLIGATLAQRGVRPAQVLASTAERVRETLARVQVQQPAPAPVRFERGLYLAPAGALLERLQVVEDEIDALLLVAHNPGLEDLVKGLAPTGDPGALRRLVSGLPTAGLAELEFPLGRWQQLRPGAGKLVSFVRPKDLV